jgi:hypothetical protein
MSGLTEGPASGPASMLLITVSASSFRFEMQRPVDYIYLHRPPTISGAGG